MKNMVYFILWVVFLVGIILAVPIASWIDKRNAVAGAEPSNDLGEGASGEESGDDGMLEGGEDASLGEEFSVEEFSGEAESVGAEAVAFAEDDPFATG